MGTFKMSRRPPRSEVIQMSGPPQQAPSQPSAPSPSDSINAKIRRLALKSLDRGDGPAHIDEIYRFVRSRLEEWDSLEDPQKSVQAALEGLALERRVFHVRA